MVHTQQSSRAVKKTGITLKRLHVELACYNKLMLSNKIKTSLWRALALTIIVAGFLVQSGALEHVRADKAADLRSQISKLEKEIVENESMQEHYHQQARTVQAAVNEANHQIAVISKQIELTSLKLKELSLKLKQTREDLEHQKQILTDALRQSYIVGDVRTIELVAGSDSFSEFFDQQDYLNRIQSTIKDSATKVAQLEEKLVSQVKQQKTLLEQQEDQRVSQQEIRSAKQRLLNETRGQEAAYSARVARIEKQKKEVERALNAYIASLVAGGVSLGPISKGGAVGMVGMTGFTSGPHLHFGAQRGSSNVNPAPLFSDLGWQWPIPGYPMGSPYGNRCIGSYCDFHTGIDIPAPVSTVVRAVDNGEIIHRGCSSVGTVYANYSVFIKHANGYVSRYVHLKAPPGSAYDACRANTWYN